MPELPEVEVVRRGIRDWAAQRRVTAVEVYDERSLRRYSPGAEHFAASLTGVTLGDPQRRGKYLWIPLHGVAPSPGASHDPSTPARTAVVIHLGMSGQVLISRAETKPQKHLKITLDLQPDPRFHGLDELRFVDQRIFGGMQLSSLITDTQSSHCEGPQPVSSGSALSGGHTRQRFIPEIISHIAPDPLEEIVTAQWFLAALRRRRTSLKRALLDQTVISGIGNIYADEALFLARLHYEKASETITSSQSARLLTAIREVMTSALEAGGTSFDALYVNVNGASGYFDRSLHVYGQAGEPCTRCGKPIKRVAFMGRSSHFCSSCQRKR